MYEPDIHKIGPTRLGYLVNVQRQIGYKNWFVVLRKQTSKICGQNVVARILEAVKLQTTVCITRSTWRQWRHTQTKKEAFSDSRKGSLTTLGLL
jgi:hypothetical protein